MTKHWRAVNIVGLSLILLASACTKISSMNRGVTSLSNPAYLTDSTFYTHVLKNVSLTTLTVTDGSTPDLELSLSVDVARAGFTPLTNYCSVGATSNKPCKCELSWTEVNTVGGNNTPVDRSKRLDTTAVQSGLVKCQMTQLFWNEIATGTTVRMNIVQSAPNASGLSVQSIGYKKGTVVTANGDFLDDTLTPFRNIHRYSCYSKRQSSFEVQNQYVQNSVDDGSGTGTTINTTVLLANKFCVGETGGTTTGQCAALRSGYSAQSYYRNLYIRSDKLGEINSTNSFYDCPKVVESIRYSAGPSIPSSEKGKYWPLDATFALATTYSSEWSVGVRAGTILYKAGDANSVTDGCTNEDTAKRLKERGIIIKCLGYAKPPLPGGTCGTLTDNNGRVRPMVRLRRFRAIYPTTYRPNGKVDADWSYPAQSTGAGNAEADEVYVADRLVVDPTGVPTGSQIFGPKPCNFAWFDHEGAVRRDGEVDFESNMQLSNASVTAALDYARPSYASTSKYCRQDLPGNCLSSVNPDGLALPSFDRDGTPGGFIGPSCSASLSVVEETLGAPSNIKLLTSHQIRTDYVTIGSRKLYLNEVHVKPVDPWSPNYVEDLSFQACAPVADPYLEPPLHFYKQDSNTVGWCTMSYPTQNPYWVELNSRKKPLGGTIQNQAVDFPTSGGPYSGVRTYAPVQNFTSHDIGGATGLDANNTGCIGTKNTDVCLMSIGSATGDYNDCVNYLNTSAARNTCDRTVTFDSNQAARTFPLQAADTDIDSMLAQDLAKDRNYSCQYSVNADPSKIGAKIPMSACCGIVNGLPILSPILGIGTHSGHLEPYVNSVFPDIRFCGNPVDLP